MAQYPTIPPLKPYQIFDPSEGADGAGLPDYEGVQSIAITAPAAGEVSGASVAVTATITDPVGSDIAKVQFFHDQGGARTQIGADDTSGPPWSVTFDSTGVSNGSYNLTADATDDYNNVTTSPVVVVTVNN